MDFKTAESILMPAIAGGILISIVIAVKLFSKLLKKLRK
jgi:hypothetical protein